MGIEKRNDRTQPRKKQAAACEMPAVQTNGAISSTQLIALGCRKSNKIILQS